ncbi:MAG: hypothetical protein NC410_08955 [Oscillibacter sp.]|nr:hypothetical protein [Oscillibacter sp.]
MEARRKSTESDLIIDVFFTNVIRGKDGTTPHIGSNGHWYLGNSDTGVVAKGVDGKDGKNGDTPVIGENGNWWIGGVDTGKSSNASIPAGVITMWSGSVEDIPTGWKLCDGSGVLSNGSRVPDLRGRFIVGYDPSDEDYNSIGKKGGEKKHVLTEEELASHDHYFKDYYHAESKNKDVDYVDYISNKPGDLITTTRKFVGSGDSDVDNNYFFYMEHYTDCSCGVYSSTGTSISAEGHENRPPYYTLAYIIKL